MSDTELRATCPEGHEITHVVQMVVGHASIAGFNAKRLPVYDGYTDVLFDTQASFAEMRGGVKFVDDDDANARYHCAGDCGEITYDQLRFEAVAK